MGCDHQILDAQSCDKRVVIRVHDAVLCIDQYRTGFLGFEMQFSKGRPSAHIAPGARYRTDNSSLLRMLHDGIIDRNVADLREERFINMKN